MCGRAWVFPKFTMIQKVIVHTLEFGSICLFFDQLHLYSVLVSAFFSLYMSVIVGMVIVSTELARSRPVPWLGNLCNLATS